MMNIFFNVCSFYIRRFNEQFSKECLFKMALVFSRELTNNWNVYIYIDKRGNNTEVFLRFNATFHQRL